MTARQRAEEIKRLLDKFNDAHDEWEYSEIKLSLGLESKEAEEWEDNIICSEMETFYLADKIRELKPSKYMLKTYPELQDILEY